MKYRDGLRTALLEEMERDETVFVMGEGIGERGGSYKVTDGLFAKFGAGRVIDTPLSEAGFVGLGAGAAIAEIDDRVERRIDEAVEYAEASPNPSVEAFLVEIASN